MSEGPEVKRAADKIAEAILGKSIVDLQGKNIEYRLKEKIVGSKVLSVDTYAKISLFISRVVYFCAII
jgi:formamidopyrimidine-DNA glycosylase